MVRPATRPHRMRLTDHPKYESMIGYWKRHERAIQAPNAESHEEALVAMLRGWLAYADVHANEFGSKIGDDGVLGPAWGQIGEALRTLLNGQLGRLDGGALDAILVEAMRAEDFQDL